MWLKFLYTLLGADIIVTLLRAEKDESNGAWMLILATVYVVFSIVMKEMG